MLYEDSDFGKDMTNGLKNGLGAKASSIVATQAYEPTDSSIDSQMSSLHASGANVLVLNVTPQYAILAYLAAHKFGWHPKIYVSSVCISPNVMDIVRASVGAPWRTARSRSRSSRTRPTRPGPRTRPSSSTGRSSRSTRPGAKPQDVYNFYGMGVAFSMVDALKRAGKSPTRASLLQAATHLNEVNPFMRPGIRIVDEPDGLLPDLEGPARALRQGALGAGRAARRRG